VFFFVLFLEYLYIYIHVTYAYLDKFILVITMEAVSRMINKSKGVLSESKALIIFIRL